MADRVGEAMLIGVVLLLGLSLLRQFAAAGPRWDLLDRLGIVIQWKFFGQAAIATNPSCFDDYHLLARRAAETGPGGWSELLWSDERGPADWLWNPAQRRHLVFMTELERLAMADTPPQPTALAYLTVLRLCLDRLRLGNGEALQFAIVATRGRGGRAVALRFISKWHCA